MEQWAKPPGLEQARSAGQGSQSSDPPGWATGPFGDFSGAPSHSLVRAAGTLTSQGTDCREGAQWMRKIGILYAPELMAWCPGCVTSMGCMSSPAMLLPGLGVFSVRTVLRMRGLSLRPLAGCTAVCREAWGREPFAGFRQEIGSPGGWGRGWSVEAGSHTLPFPARAGARVHPSSTPETRTGIGGKTSRFRGHSVWLGQRSKIC